MMTESSVTPRSRQEGSILDMEPATHDPTTAPAISDADASGWAARAVLAGALAAGPALFVLVAARLVTGDVGLLDAVADGVVRYTPPSLVEGGISALGPLGKGILSLGVAVGVVAAGALAGLAVDRWLLRWAGSAAPLVVGLGAIAGLELALLPLAGAGFLGAELATDPLALHAPLVAACLLYAGVVVRLLRPPVPPLPPMSDEVMAVPEATAREAGMPRRTFLGGSVGVAAVAALAAGFGGVVLQVVEAVRGHAGPVPSAGPDATGFGPPPAVTPVDDFYVVSKNLTSPRVDGSTWRLVVDGLVDRPTAYSLAELQAMPSKVAFRTLECISFEIVRGDRLIGNQSWRGVPVSTLLDRAGVQPGAAWILWEAADGYTESLALDVARQPDTWIAWQMGGAPLTPDHGYPARVLIPGRFGMKQPKWVTRMRLSERDERGYWEVRGWDDQAVVRTMSRIDSPRPGDRFPVGSSVRASGVAYSGDRGIAAVELSPDDGRSWLRAELEDASRPPLGPLTWVRWRVDVPLVSAGPTRFVVRATDGAGGLQDGQERPPLPAGATGWHAIRVVAE
ncbi:MAG TPA: molybdopterin-dependent oxidoreductase [Candidatus Limnocylindrales bacterium]|nr:molybdopterin-dependent oxidoreductase [Candidatus Limnocylindrales bacterium]